VVDVVEDGDGDRLEEGVPYRLCRLNPCLLKYEKRVPTELPAVLATVGVLPKEKL
jgi:hypothetical protein